MDGREGVEISLDELHHRIHDLRDHLFKGETVTLNSGDVSLAVIRPLADGDRLPEQALVRSITHIRLHKRMFTFKIREGCSIVLTYHGRKVGVVEPALQK